MPDGSVESFDIGILLWVSGLDVMQLDAAFLCPGHQLMVDVFRAIVQTEP